MSPLFVTMITHPKKLVQSKINPPGVFFSTVLVLLTPLLFNSLDDYSAWAGEPVLLEPEAVEVVDVFPDENNPAYQVVKTKDGHYLRVPKGMQLERKGGVIDLYSTEEHLMKKMGQMQDEMDELKDRVLALEVGAKESEGKGRPILLG